MNTQEKLMRIKLLKTHLENGGSVVRPTLRRVIGVSGLNEFNKAWRDEKLSHKNRPEEILEYSKRLKKGLQLYSRAENSSFKPNHYKSKKLMEHAESVLENALEYLRDMCGVTQSLRIYIDRDPWGSIELCPEGVPRPIWSTSAYKQPCFNLKNSKQVIALEILEKYQNRLKKRLGVTEEIALPTTIKNRKKLALTDFSDFKF
ncbi:hypothetical protein [Polynucleobacter sp. HIN5]|uniref:hypothetical protein n=1 Tax=Polynucleobacter sp. HIN5 TaxID=3047864 RepID=UPI002572702D|nr:hypothetical protein [Polynucleobacter sp. HIN5]BEI33212.1 hypothetical protein PHIN5_05800 [Polynucleobacter sp. HIN5]